MSQSVTWNGVSYSVPDPNDTGWGPSLTSYLVALPAGALQKNGGTFTLTNDVDFGANFGLKSLYFKSRSANIAASGVFRLANAEAMAWRNAANNADLLLAVNASNQLTFNGNVLFPSTGILPIAAGGTNSSAALNNNRVMQSSGGAIVEAAAITGNRALISDANGIPTQSAVTNTELGYLSGVTSAVQTQMNVALNAPQNLIINAGMEIWQRNTTFSSPATNVYTADRWFINARDGGTPPTYTVSRDSTGANVDRGVYSMKVDITNAGATSNNLNVGQLVENYTDYLGKTVTVSVRVKTSTANKVRVRLSDGLSSVLSSYHTGGGTFETLTASMTLSASGTLLSVVVGYFGDAMAISTFWIDSVMLVAGPTAATYIPTDPGLDLVRCQRYYEKSYQMSVAAGGSGTSNQYTTAMVQFNTTSMECALISFKVRKRVTPTVTLYQSDGSTNNWQFCNTSGTFTARTTSAPEILETGFARRPSVAVESLGVGHWVADAEM